MNPRSDTIMALSGMPTSTGLEEKVFESEGVLTRLDISTKQSNNHQLYKDSKIENGGNARQWSPWKKGLVFAALMSSSFLADGLVFCLYIYNLFPLEKKPHPSPKTS
jgi:hypothetical protein